MMLTPQRCKQQRQPGRYQGQIQQEICISKINKEPGNGERKRYISQPGNNEHVDVGGNKKERVGESKDDGNAEDGGKPSERGFGLDRVAKCQKNFTQIISVQPNLPQEKARKSRQVFYI